VSRNAPERLSRSESIVDCGSLSMGAGKAGSRDGYRSSSELAGSISE
jgi:hypothetical protein